VKVHAKRDCSRRLPECMLCVLDHLAPGLPPGPQALLIRYGRHAHDGGCGIWPGLRSLSRELRASPVTLRQWRADLQARGLVHRLPRAGPHGADLLRLGPCEHCPQRDSMQSRCERCQRDSLQHAETEWWAAQRDCMQSQKILNLQEATAAALACAGSPPAAASPNGATRHSGSAGPSSRPADRRQSKQKATTSFLPGPAASPTDDREPTAPHHVAAPAASTGDPVLHPGDGQLFETNGSHYRDPRRHSA
jgi:hypothetical protein